MCMCECVLDGWALASVCRCPVWVPRLGGALVGGSTCSAPPLYIRSFGQPIMPTPQMTEILDIKLVASGLCRLLSGFPFSARQTK